MMKKNLYRLFGFSFFVIGTVGIFLPLVPTVPFYLIALIFLLRTSKRDIVKLKRIPIIGKLVYPYIKKSLLYLKKWNTQPQSSYT